MAVTYEDVNPSLVENTIMRKLIIDGVHQQYTVRAIDGYVLHDSRLDIHDEDYETGEPIFAYGYTAGTKTIPATYDFEANPFNLFAVPRSEVPENQIFGGGDNDHETM